jgi:hypothetical protein
MQLGPGETPRMPFRRTFFCYNPRHAQKVLAYLVPGILPKAPSRVLSSTAEPALSSAPERCAFVLLTAAKSRHIWVSQPHQG